MDCGDSRWCNTYFVRINLYLHIINYTCYDTYTCTCTVFLCLLIYAYVIHVIVVKVKCKVVIIHVIIYIYIINKRKTILNNA